ncbi:hypothetical protein QE410_000438 [Microbacterium sp. SORGH_AS 1204]|nr:hypothetical protein [Microbacterium sp. SORGH_AS_1204]MDQ1135639.1 hypothetical protein [Microbacterium sp. SORGH_AS_1204]
MLKERRRRDAHASVWLAARGQALAYGGQVPDVLGRSAADATQASWQRGDDAVAPELGEDTAGTPSTAQRRRVVGEMPPFEVSGVEESVLLPAYSE